MNKGLFSSNGTEYETPGWLFEELNREFQFTLDPCSTKDNAKCQRFFTTDDNGLLKDWGHDRVFMNPPYGREIRDWLRKALNASRAGALVVCLLPARTDTSWWHEYAMRGEIRFIEGRLRFKTPKGKEGPRPFRPPSSSSGDGLLSGPHEVAMITISGRTFNREVQELTLEDLAYHLGLINRWAGIAPGWSVLDHSLFVAELAKRQGLSDETIETALFHDAHEIITGDVPRPWKTDAVRILCNEIQALIERALRIPPPQWGVRFVVSILDNHALAAESYLVIAPSAAFEARSHFDPRPEDLKALEEYRSRDTCPEADFIGLATDLRRRRNDQVLAEAGAAE